MADLSQFGIDSSSDNCENNSDCLNDGDVVRYRLTDEEREHVRDIARARHASYSDGRTRDESWGGDDDSFGAMARGVAGELVLALLYGAPFDSEISESGDDGVDTELELGGETRTVDVKTSTYDGPGQSLMVATHHVSERERQPDAYLRAHVDESLSAVTLQGWIRSDELLREDMIEPSPAGEWLNYDASVDELRPMPRPDEDTMAEHGGAEIVQQ
jgi:hypothetical protein